MIDTYNIEKYQENNRIEAKLARGGLPHSLWETYSAFANTNGGVILLGIEENKDHSFTVRGLNNAEEMLQQFITLLHNPLKVKKNILSETHYFIKHIEEKACIIIEVPKANRKDKPIYINNDLYYGTYRRDGEGDYHCTKEEIDTMITEEIDDTETTYCYQYHVNDLNQKTIISYCKQLPTSFHSLSYEECLLKIGAINEQHNPTIQGVLMFGTYDMIINTFPYFHLQYRQRDNNNQFINQLQSNYSINNLFDFYSNILSILKQSINNKSLYPSIDNILINTLIHTNYRIKGGILIEKKQHEIIFSNPGNLRISIEEVCSGGISDCRNQQLINFFKVIKKSEHGGNSLKDIIEAYKQMDYPPFTIYEQFNPDRTILILPLEKKNNLKKSSLQTIDYKQGIIDYLTYSIISTEKNISRHLSLRYAQTKSLLNELLSENIIVKNQENESTIYKLKR